MTYTVLARKYRPQKFADLVGQQHVMQTIGNAIASGRVAHAFLFTGARGVGKTSTARLLAKALNCEQGPTSEPCNACDPCKEITRGNDLDVLEMDGASNNSVDDVRRLQEGLPYRPARDRFKVVIVDEVHMLSTGAFNAFLKTLEEPPSHVKFIFATTEAHKVPITIRSRCQRHDFRLIPQAVIVTHIREILAAENISADDAALHMVAREAAGSMRDALTVLDQLLAFAGDSLTAQSVAQGLGIADRQQVISVTQALLEGDPAACLRAVHALGEAGLDVLHFSKKLSEFLRDLVVLNVVGKADGTNDDLVNLSPDEQQAANEMAKSHEAAELERAFAGVSELIDKVAQSGSPRLTLEMGLVRLADRPRLRPLSELISKLDALLPTLASGRPLPQQAAPRPNQQPPTHRPTNEPKAANPQRPSGPPSQHRPAPSAVSVRSAPSDPATPAAPAAPPARVAAAAPAQSTQPARERFSAPNAAPATTQQASTPPVAREAPAIAQAPSQVPMAPMAPMAQAPNAEWASIVAKLRERQPALGAILEHGVATEVTAERLILRFPEGSFFGRQAKAPSAKDAILNAAAEVLGERPRLEVEFGKVEGQATLAQVESQAKQARTAATRHEALTHPAVVDALEVFPEAQGKAEVVIKSD